MCGSCSSLNPCPVVTLSLGKLSVSGTCVFDFGLSVLVAVLWLVPLRDGVSLDNSVAHVRHRCQWGAYLLVALSSYDRNSKPAASTPPVRVTCDNVRSTYALLPI